MIHPKQQATTRFKIFQNALIFQPAQIEKATPSLALAWGSIRHPQVQELCVFAANLHTAPNRPMMTNDKSKVSESECPFGLRSSSTPN
jgi:hypothetical protein